MSEHGCLRSFECEFYLVQQAAPDQNKYCSKDVRRLRNVFCSKQAGVNKQRDIGDIHLTLIHSKSRPAATTSEPGLYRSYPCSHQLCGFTRPL